MTFLSCILRLWIAALFVCMAASDGLSQFLLSNPIDNCSMLYINFGVGISTHDFDRDGLDDITICDSPCGVRAFRNLGNGDFGLYYTFPSLITAKCPTWVDYDNDGDSDFFFTCDNSMIQLYRNDGIATFSNVTTSLVSTQAFARSMGASWGDYDRDGWLDLYVCNYNFLNEHNWLFHNNGDGTFDEISEQMGVDNGFRFSFQSTWCDLNMDGWQDLYVVNDLADTNTFYLNQSGVFVESSADFGLNIVLNSMCNSISDYDLDGDFDIYVSGTPQGNFLMRNDDGVFINIVEGTELVVNEWSWSGLWMDYDNDSDDDLHVSTRGLPLFPGKNPFYINEGGQLSTITNYGLQGDLFESTCAGKGDFNNDGRWDFAVSNQAPPSTNIWTNIEQTPGHWIKLGLEGTVSNRDGVGSIIRCYHGGMMNLVQTYCGENYMSQDSQYEIIGLGDDVLVDSLVITWPSGWIDRYYNLGMEQYYALVEGETFTASIAAENDGVMCEEGDELILSAGNYVQWNWSTTDSTQTIAVSQPGIYNVVVQNQFGFEATASIEVLLSPAPELSIEAASPTCFGLANGSIHLEVVNEDAYTFLWNNESETSFQNNLPAGAYSCTLTNEFGCEYESNISLIEPPQLEFSLESTPIVCYGQTATVIPYITGGTGIVDINWNGVDPESIGAGDYIFEAADVLGCLATASIDITSPAAIEVTDLTLPACFESEVAIEVTIEGGTSPYNLIWSVEDTTSVTAGNYDYTITDAQNCEVSGSIEVAQTAAIETTFSVTEANDGSNGSIELFVSGGTPPYTFFWNTGFDSNPIENLGQGTYECIVTDALGCIVVSPSIAMIDAGIGDQGANEFSVFPNPFAEVITISFSPNAFGKEFMILNNNGQVVFKSRSTAHAIQLDTTSWSAGLYHLQCGEASKRVMKH